MPHLVVRSIDTTKLQNCSFVQWVANDSKDGKFALLHVGEFLVEVKKRDNDYVIRADKLTRCANVEKIKQVLLQLSQELNLEVLEQNVNLKNEKKESQFLKPISFFEDFDLKGKVLNIEVGFGSGRHLLYQAKKYPDQLFIGLEVHTTSVEQVVKQIEIQKLKNLLVVNYDARLFLEFIPSNSCRNIFVHFPVPWDKKPHRRVISQSFVDESMRVLEKGGVLNLRTDSQNYFAYSFETFFAQTVCECKIAKNREIEISSKYEDRWKKQNKNIYDFYLTSLEYSPPKQVDYDFSFSVVPQLEYEFKSMKFENFFVRFENLFTIDENRYLVKVSFGSFDKPENRYIYIENKKASYLFNDPVKTHTNYLAHKKIAEML